MMKFVKLLSKDIVQARTQIKIYHGTYEFHFKTKTRDVIDPSKNYLYGCLTVSKRKTMTEMTKVVPDSNNQSMQHFISNSLWDEEGLIHHLQDDMVELIGDKKNGSLHLDESGFPKQGTNSAGVQRQYCGRLGKVENCQVGVFLGYVNENKRTLIDKRLYIPEKWINDAARRKRCKIPEDLVFKTKAELGLEMILNAKKRNIPFGWVFENS